MIYGLVIYAPYIVIEFVNVLKRSESLFMIQNFPQFKRVYSHKT